MSFLEGVKKKFLGEESQVQKAAPGGRRVGSMGKAYTGGGGTYVKTEKGVGFDASTYSDAKPRGKVAKMSEFNANRTGAGRGGEKGLFGQAVDYVAPKAKAAGKWMQDRGMELNGDLPKKGRKKVSARVPRRSQPPGYDGGLDMFGGGGMGMGGGGMDSDMFGVGNYGGMGGGGGGHWETRGTIISGGEAYEEVAPRRRRKSRRRPSREEREESGGFDMNHIPESMRGMF